MRRGPAVNALDAGAAPFYNVDVQPVLILDFDGTLTNVDVGDAVCERFAPPEWKLIDERWARREISLPEAQRQMWALVRATRDEAIAGARLVGHLRPGVDALLDAAARARTPVWLASGGFDFYIEALLGERMKQFARAWFNTTTFDGDRLTVGFPHLAMSCGMCAVCKGKVCEAARATGADRVIFVGDGHSDRCAIGKADLIAAVRGSQLARWCGEHAVAHVEFDRLDEIVHLAG